MLRVHLPSVPVLSDLALFILSCIMLVVMLRSIGMLVTVSHTQLPAIDVLARTTRKGAAKCRNAGFRIENSTHVALTGHSLFQDFRENLPLPRFLLSFLNMRKVADIRISIYN